jgi:hypothetical protein
MRAGPLPEPGQLVCWRHPRLAFARGLFHAFGPGPFPVLGLVGGGERGLPLAVLVRTESGDRQIDAAWVGPAAPRRGP